jgi:hypothetical protein
MSAELFIPIVALSLPAVLVFLHKHFRYKEKLLELQARGGSPPLLSANAESSEGRLAELEARVQNLESIIVAMDSELGALPGRAGREDLRRIAGSAAAPALSEPSAAAARLTAGKTEPTP